LKQCKTAEVDIEPVIHKEIEKMIFYTISVFKPNKKTINAVLYEIAKLSLFYKNSESLISCGFHILN